MNTMCKNACSLFHKSLLAISILLLIVLLNSQIVSAPITYWTIETADSSPDDVGRYTSIAMNGNDVHISYYDATNGDLKYIKKNGNTNQWSNPEIVDSAGTVGWWTSLKLVNGNPRIAYYDPANGILKYAEKNGVWSSPEIVDQYNGPIGPFASLAFDKNGKAHIAYYDFLSWGVRYATRNGPNSWTFEYVIPSPPFYPVGRYTSLAFDTSDNPFISYRDDQSKCLMCAWRPAGGTVWTHEWVDSAGDVGECTSIAWSGGTAHISYYDRTNGHLKYATRLGPSNWNTETADYASDVGFDTSLAFESGEPCISYYDITNQDLKYARKVGSNWETETVDSGGNVGSWTSLSFCSNGDPHISYYDTSSGDLKHAYPYHYIPPPGAPEMPFGMGLAFFLALPALLVYLRLKRPRPRL